MQCVNAALVLVVEVSLKELQSLWMTVPYSVNCTLGKMTQIDSQSFEAVPVSTW